MKRMMLKVGSSRLRWQRGMVRVGLVGVIAVALGGGVFAMHRDKIALFRQPHVSATQAQRDCGCSAERKAAAKQDNLVGHYAPSVSHYSQKEIASFPTSVLLQAGASLNLSNISWKKTLGPTAVWKATSGFVDSTGIYTAPPYTPSGGIDTITLSAPGQPKVDGVRLLVHILPNPAIAGSSGTPYYQYKPAGETVLGTTYYTHSLVLPLGMKSIPPQFLHNIIGVFDPSDAPVPAAPLTQKIAVPTVDVAGSSFYVLPIKDRFGAPMDGWTISTQSAAQSLLQAKELPVFAGSMLALSDPVAMKEGKCKENTTWEKLISKQKIPTAEAPTVLGSVEISGQLGIDLKEVFKFDAGVKSTVNILATPVNWLLEEKYDIYQCLHGKAEIIGSKTCRAVDTVYQDATPPFADSIFKGLQDLGKYPDFGQISKFAPREYDGQPQFGTPVCGVTYNH